MSFKDARKNIARTARRGGDSVVLGMAGAIFVAQQFAISYLEPSGYSGIFRQVLFFSTTVILAVLALRLRRFAGAWLISVGILLNLAPMALHNGSMPIDYAILHDSRAFPEVTQEDVGRQTNHGKDIVLYREDIHLFALSDRYVVSLPLYGTNIYSLGDFILFAGFGAVVVQVVSSLAAAPLGLATRRRKPSLEQPGTGHRP